MPSFTIQNTTTGENTVTITNQTEPVSSFQYLLSDGETLTFNGYNKILSSNIAGKNPYSS